MTSVALKRWNFGVESGALMWTQPPGSPNLQVRRPLSPLALLLTVVLRV